MKAGAPVTSEDEARQWSVKFGSATPKSPEIPKNQRCVGDYCHVQIHDPKQLFTEEEMRAFTGSDVDALRSLGKGGRGERRRGGRRRGAPPGRTLPRGRAELN